MYYILEAVVSSRYCDLHVESIIKQNVLNLYSGKHFQENSLYSCMCGFIIRSYSDLLFCGNLIPDVL